MPRIRIQRPLATRSRSRTEGKLTRTFREARIAPNAAIIFKLMLKSRLTWGINDLRAHYEESISCGGRTKNQQLRRVPREINNLLRPPQCSVPGEWTAAWSSSDSRWVMLQAPWHVERVDIQDCFCDLNIAVSISEVGCFGGNSQKPHFSQRTGTQFVPRQKRATRGKVSSLDIPFL